LQFGLKQLNQVAIQIDYQVFI